MDKPNIASVRENRIVEFQQLLNKLAPNILNGEYSQYIMPNEAIVYCYRPDFNPNARNVRDMNIGAHYGLTDFKLLQSFAKAYWGSESTKIGKDLAIGNFPAWLYHLQQICQIDFSEENAAEKIIDYITENKPKV